MFRQRSRQPSLSGKRQREANFPLDDGDAYPPEAASSPGSSFDRPVVDQTDLGGRYDLTLEWVPEPPRGPTPPDVGAQPKPQQGPTFLEAFHDQLGLKLESTKGPM